VYGLKFLADGKLVTVGQAPKNAGFLGIWNPADGKLIFGEELPVGPIYAVTVSPDGKQLALGCGATGRLGQEPNTSYIIKMPEVK
jgi:hypothetical protein